MKKALHSFATEWSFFNFSSFPSFRIGSIAQMIPKYDIYKWFLKFESYAFEKLRNPKKSRKTLPKLSLWIISCSCKTKMNWFLSTNMPCNFHTFLPRKLHCRFNFLEILQLQDQYMTNFDQFEKFFICFWCFPKDF